MVLRSSVGGGNGLAFPNGEAVYTGVVGAMTAAIFLAVGYDTRTSIEGHLLRDVNGDGVADVIRYTRDFLPGGDYVYVHIAMPDGTALPLKEYMQRQTASDAIAEERQQSVQDLAERHVREYLGE